MCVCVCECLSICVYMRVCVRVCECVFCETREYGIEEEQRQRKKK